MFDIEYRNLSELKDILKPIPYGLLNIMQTNIINGEFDTVRRLVTHILSLKPKDLIDSCSDKYDAIDIIVLFMESLQTSQTPLMKDEIYQFWECCKDILFYNASKKKKVTRSNIIYIFLYTLCKNSLKYKRLLEDKEERTTSSHCDPLFIIFNYDYQTMAEVQSLKNRRNVNIEENKVIKVQDCSLINDGIPRKDTVEVVKT
jgi:hypothetical protein